MGAEQMGNNPVMELLRQNLQQEEQTAQTVEQCLPQLLQQMMLVTQPVR
jgi:ferritin-like metal-binding protein YciE